MQARHLDASLGLVPLWAVVILVLAAVWLVGSMVIAIGARRLVRSRPN